MKRIIGVLFSILVLFSSTTSFGAVALHIYFHDGFAFSQQSEDLFEQIFADLRPDLKFRRISVPSDEIKNRTSRDDLQRKISSALLPHEELAVLIIDTHGGTEAIGSGALVTSLRHLGSANIAEVDQQFKNTFSGLKEKATNDLQVILNSCSVFCGGEESASQRAKSILDYFGAMDGSIYGSDVNEVTQAFDDRRYFKWKYLVPDFKMVVTVAGVTSALLFPLAGYENYLAMQVESLSLLEAIANASLKSLSVGGGISAAAAMGAPIAQSLLSRYFLNRGYYFSFKDGKLVNSRRVTKYKDLRRLIGCSALLR